MLHEVGRKLRRGLERVVKRYDPLAGLDVGHGPGVRGDEQHPLLGPEAAETIQFFYACPLVVSGGGLGALGVYMERGSVRTRLDSKNRTFLELCAGIIADRLNALHKSERVERAEDMLEEIRSNLVREREASRFGDRALEFYSEITQGLSRLRSVIFSRLPYEKRVAQAKELFKEIEREKSAQESQLAAMKSSLRMLDLFALVAEVVRIWAPTVIDLGVELTTRIPREGPSLLANHESIRIAVRSVLDTLATGVKKDDRVLVECSTTEDKAMICIADTGDGLPGHLLSRLFMPFGEPEGDDENRNVMSVAGDILQRHGGEISVKSSPSWKTILVIAFPMASNRDRRDTPRDRRRRNDRRVEPAEA
ncbi:MAG: HAMP domain-containing histidine kinase [Candidatus Krumholzibacteriota bacterium]|nr:HAMP domain-containing histidine kinase [Candidatus Krumholzibacteriota bacterium]